MNTSKKINVNVSSLVGLKAELLRKHSEVKDAKAKIDITKPTLSKTKLKNKKINSKNEEVSEIENVTEIEDVDTLKKSKYMLIAKSRLYDKLKKNHGEINDNYLVDFKNKYESSEDESSMENDDYVDTNIDPDEDWVDYEDCFGRTRKCLRKDLPRMNEKDSLIQREIIKNPIVEENEKYVQLPVFIPPEKEPEIEIMRKKWEEQTEKLSKKSDIHYQDILFDEARTHGVGYYAFSHDEDERAKQQLNLTKLRKETEQKQKELKEIKDLKNKMEENRLKTARIRARIRAGLPPEPTQEIENNSTKCESTSNNENSEPQSPNTNDSEKDSKLKSNDENNLIVIEDKIEAFGKLLGKRLPWRELSQEEWVHKRRKDRQGEFAPVYDNFKSGGVLMATKLNQLTTSDNDYADPLRVYTGGPEPTDFWESSELPHDVDDDKIAVELGSSNKIATPEHPTDSTNFTELQSFNHPTLPPSFDPSIPPPSVINNISADTPKFIPLTPVPYPAYLPSFTNPISSQLSSIDMENKKKNRTEKINETNSVESSSDSDDSDIIGPMPQSIEDNEILAQIPLPDQPGPSIKKSNSFTSNTNSEYFSSNTNVDKIEAGLKYLRQKFETSNSNE